jgi:ketosteroid isomerase-like protein
MSTGEKNKALVCRFLEAQSTGDLEALDELLALDFVDHGLLPGQDAHHPRPRALSWPHGAYWSGA